MKTDGKFYLGRLHDLKAGQTGDQALLYDPDDLTTHGVVFGMTGSGKTGLCIDILEEAALNGIPALMIDPKGDITNALLHFPELRPEDFQPWVNADEARRAKQSVEEFAAATAATWKQGLADWDIAPERITALSEAAEFAVFTPGSDAGMPVSILATLEAPELDWDEHKEVIRERIAATATAILGLVGFDGINPVKSRKHILLANIFEAAWSKGRDLDLGTLIQQVQQPPVDKLGVFEVNEFFPAKEREKLALQLNNILAAPSFQTWLQGEPLDIGQLMFAKDGRPRHSVFTLAHLSDSERMFFVTLLYSAIETWMRTQPGSSSLRAIVYFDEIHGYLPPVAEPPSKGPMLRLLKQARAFGIGQLLATQNPVDVDYKALSNAGTWFIGKLQTERDKERLLDGLEGAAQGDFSRKEYDKIISELGKRVFLLHNVHEKAPAVFHTRWAMNYLPGPLTRSQIPALNQLAGRKSKVIPDGKSKKTKDSKMDATSTRPTIPAGLQEVFLPASLGLDAAAEASRRPLPGDAERKGILYRPALLAQAQIRYLKRTYNLDYESRSAALVEEAPESGNLRWEDYMITPVPEARIESRPVADAVYASLEGLLADGRKAKGLESDFVDWLYRSQQVQVWHNAELKLYGSPVLSQEAFIEQCRMAAEIVKNEEIKKTQKTYERKLDSLDKKLDREKRQLSEDEQEVSQRKLEEYGTHAENILSLFSGRRRSLTTSLTKRRMTANAKADAEESLQTIKDLEDEIDDMAAEIEEVVDEINTRWEDAAADVEQIAVPPLKKDIYVSTFAVAWLPYHRIESGGRESDIPAWLPEA
jgi:hypothetical protein